MAKLVIELKILQFKNVYLFPNKLANGFAVASESHASTPLPTFATANLIEPQRAKNRHWHYTNTLATSLKNMSDKELNIKSSTIEKGLDLAKNFLDKLINPTVEQVGLLFADKIQYFRLKNQINIIIKAKKFIEDKDITIKELPIKILAPLLEECSLEDNEELQDIWAKMLANLVDSNKNLQNNIFPFILSQLSIQEYKALENFISLEKDSATKYQEYASLKLELYPDDSDPQVSNTEESDKKRDRYYELYNSLIQLEQSGFKLSADKVEVANLERLALIRRLPPKISVSKTGMLPMTNLFTSYSTVYNMSDIGHRITALGINFIEVCTLDRT